MLVKSVYKPPNTILTSSDLNILTQSSECLISAGDYNAKHLMWFTWTTNPEGTTLFNHDGRNDYSIVAPDSPTRYQPQPGFRPDVLDIALAKLPYNIQAINLNELSSDNNPILLDISSSLKTSPPPIITQHVNWVKFSETLNGKQWAPCANIPSEPETENAISNFTYNITNNLEKCNFTPSQKHAFHSLPPEILMEISNFIT